MCLICGSKTCDVNQDLQVMIRSGMTAPAVEEAMHKEHEHSNQLEEEIRSVRQAMKDLRSRYPDLFDETLEDVDEEEDEEDEEDEEGEEDLSNNDEHIKGTEGEGKKDGN
ncbi:hypothetical protein BD626DRAFT_573861 [Schizophyllum amplum]|uniref:Uncharacterized protein n=1 Tax=Schizophyllum amplum TaxID=97359 RepID=A0A550BZQ8_9AGAR|nr:hypothetical protein BD626DRAFT_576175 [Auriculariopsis ampla]TRM58042.1 hypothetical protein BD626DRAFT_573861 [Auriculariopsis ampla]